jgi:hypothetical protein
MKNSVYAILFLFATSAVYAQSGPSTNGSFVFSSGGYALGAEFNARLHSNGRTSGDLTLTGTVAIPDQDVDGLGSGGGNSVTTVTLKVNVDCLALKGNQAVLTGKIVQSTTPAYAGRHLLLAVEDNGEGVKQPAPDRFMWGVYGAPEAGWIPSDAELTSDPGVGLTWLATDAERVDDIGIPSHRSGVVDCHTFPVGSYSLEDLQHGDGNLQVRP